MAGFDDELHSLDTRNIRIKEQVYFILDEYSEYFEEFLWAMGMGEEAIEEIEKKLTEGESLDKSAHEYIMKQLKYYLLVGGLPEAVDLFAQSRNLFNVRTVQRYRPIWKTARSVSYIRK